MSTTTTTTMKKTTMSTVPSNQRQHHGVELDIHSVKGAFVNGGKGGGAGLGVKWLCNSCQGNKMKINLTHTAKGITTRVRGNTMTPTTKFLSRSNFSNSNTIPPIPT